MIVSLCESSDEAADMIMESMSITETLIYICKEPPNSDFLLTSLSMIGVLMSNFNHDYSEIFIKYDLLKALVAVWKSTIY